jgi:hypothetical protein
MPPLVRPCGAPYERAQGNSSLRYARLGESGSIGATAGIRDEMGAIVPDRSWAQGRAELAKAGLTAA